MNAFFADLPKSLEEAARVDGASRFWTSFLRIALPLSLPGIVTTAILCLVFVVERLRVRRDLLRPGSQTLPIAASQLMHADRVDWGQLTAIGTFVVAPMILVGLIGA